MTTQELAELISSPVADFYSVNTLIASVGLDYSWHLRDQMRDAIAAVALARGNPNKVKAQGWMLGPGKNYR